MTAKLMRLDHGKYMAEFRHRFPQPPAEVWAALTETDQLKNWMPNLEMKAAGEGGSMRFNMNDGSGEGFDLEITEFHEGRVLEFDWGETFVRFSVSEKEGGSLLILIDLLLGLDDHAAKDLAGWDICLERLEGLLAGKPMPFYMEAWEDAYGEYKKLMELEDL